MENGSVSRTDVSGQLADPRGELSTPHLAERVFITGLIGFARSSALGGAATSFGLLVTARALQGSFGAILAPAALGTLVSTFRDPRDRGRAFGVFGAVAVGGGAVGLLLGGALTEYLSWRWALYVNLIFAALAVAGALAYLRTNRPASRPRLDYAGTLLASAGLFCIVFGFSHAETAGWSAALTIGSLALGVALLAAFGVTERRVSAPLLPLRVVLDRTRGGAYVAVGFVGISIFGVFLFLTYYLQTIKGYSPLACGLAFLPMIGCVLVSSTISSTVTLPRFGPRAVGQLRRSPQQVLCPARIARRCPRHHVPRERRGRPGRRGRLPAGDQGGGVTAGRRWYSGIEDHTVDIQ
jgi:MFS family permease